MVCFIVSRRIRGSRKYQCSLSICDISEICEKYQNEYYPNNERMKSGKLFLIVALAGCFFITACSNTRHLPADERLYTGANVVVDGAASIREKKVLEEDLEGLTRPRPNSKLFGIRMKLWIHNLFRNKKENSFFGRIRERSGEPPVLLSELDLDQNIRVLQSHLENKGYFRAKVTGDTIIRTRRRANARYHAE